MCPPVWFVTRCSEIVPRADTQVRPYGLSRDVLKSCRGRTRRSAPTDSSPSKSRRALLQERAHAFAAIFRFETSNLRFDFVLQHLLQRVVLAGIDRVFCGGD